MAIVEPDERSAAAGITTIARSTGAALAPALTGLLLTWSLSAPFIAAGGLKILYDVLLFRGFRAMRTPEELAGRWFRSAFIFVRSAVARSMRSRIERLLLSND